MRKLGSFQGLLQLARVVSTAEEYTFDTSAIDSPGERGLVRQSRGAMPQNWKL
jgi:hypothetical protein